MPHSTVVKGPKVLTVPSLNRAMLTGASGLLHLLLPSARFLAQFNARQQAVGAVVRRMYQLHVVGYLVVAMLSCGVCRWPL